MILSRKKVANCSTFSVSFKWVTSIQNASVSQENLRNVYFCRAKVKSSSDESFDRPDDRMTANMDPCYKVSSKFLNDLWLLSFIIWLAPWAGKMKLSCLLGTTCYILEQIFYQKPYNKSFIIQSRWLDIGLVLFFASLWTSTSSRSIHVNTHKKRTWPTSSHVDLTLAQ